MIIKAAKRIFNSDKICRSYSDLNFGVTFFRTQCILYSSCYRSSILLNRRRCHKLRSISVRMRLQVDKELVRTMAESLRSLQDTCTQGRNLLAYLALVLHSSKGRKGDGLTRSPWSLLNLFVLRRVQLCQY